MKRLSNKYFDRLDAQFGEALLPILQRCGENATPEDLFRDALDLPGATDVPESNLRAYLAMKLEDYLLMEEAIAVLGGE